MRGTPFIGPAAIVQAARFVFDSRDRGIEPRLDVLDRPDGVWPCESLMECTRVCPRGIKVTKNINLTKREIKTFKGEKPSNSTNTRLGNCSSSTACRSPEGDRRPHASAGGGDSRPLSEDRP